MKVSHRTPGLFGIVSIIVLVSLAGCGAAPVGNSASSIGLSTYGSSFDSAVPSFNPQSAASLRSVAVDWSAFQTTVIRKVFGNEEITTISRGVALVDAVINAINSRVTLDSGTVAGAAPCSDLALTVFGLGLVDVDYKLILTNLSEGNVTIPAATVWLKKGDFTQSLIIFIPDLTVGGVSSRFIIYGHRSGNTISLKQVRYSWLISNNSYLGSGRYQFDGDTVTHVFTYKLIWDVVSGVDGNYPWVYSTSGQGTAQGTGSFGLRFTKWENSVITTEQFYICNPVNLSAPISSGDLLNGGSLPEPYVTPLGDNNRFSPADLPAQSSEVTLN